jgi:integration host factor subunit beta
MSTVTKKELIERLAEQSGLKRQDVRQVVQGFLDEVINELGKGNRLEFRDFGIFDVRERAERVAQNPKTLERVMVPAKRTARFRVGRLMKPSNPTRTARSNAHLRSSTHGRSVRFQRSPWRSFLSSPRRGTQNGFRSHRGSSAVLSIAAGRAGSGDEFVGGNDRRSKDDR